MPYIKQSDRTPVTATYPETPGELNWAVTTAALGYIKMNTPIGCRVPYEVFNAAIGALECAKQELYRRLGGPLEDAAIRRSGDLAEYAQVLAVLAR